MLEAKEVNFAYLRGQPLVLEPLDMRPLKSSKAASSSMRI